jgi:oligo-1,6-glucosidase
MFPGPAWEYVPSVGLWYLHLYGKKQPDLNWHNPKVLEEVESILRFWLDKGVYGFRCDVIDQIYKESLEDGKGHAASGRGIEHYLMTPGNHKILQTLQADVFSHYDCVVIGETFAVDYQNGRQFLDGEMNMFFQFDHMGVDKSMNPLWKKHFKAKRFMDIIYGIGKLTSGLECELP